MVQFTENDIKAIKEVWENGGSYVISVDEADIPMDDEAKAYHGPNLETGFEMRPSTIIHSPKEAAEILARADGWTTVQVRTYQNGGVIIYRRLSPGQYESTIKR